MPDVETIETERLRLVSMSPEMLRTLLEEGTAETETIFGIRFPETWPEQESWLFRLRQEQMQKDPTSQEWLLRAIVLREPADTVIGHINFHEPPHEPGGAVEIGYSIEPAHRRRGYALEAILAMFDWAEDRGAGRFIASISPTNAPSLALSRKLGFTQTGVQWDELDGEELVFELIRGRRPD